MKILSVSDVITNSSSEVFCYITGGKDSLDKIYNILENIVGYNQEYELTPVIIYNDDNITIDLPYSFNKIYDYITDAMDGLLKYPEFSNCKIEYNERL